MARGFRNIEQVLREVFATLAGGADRVGPQTPDDLDTRVAAGQVFIRVIRTGGPRGALSDTPTFDVDCYAATYDAASDLIDAAHELLLGGNLPPHTALDYLVNTSGPVERPHTANPDIRRFGASYAGGMRRTALP